MSVIVMGLSHRSTPMDVLELAALDGERASQLAEAVCAGENVAEAVVVATCNRLEVYANVRTFHGAVDEIGAALADATGIARSALNEHLYVHYEDRAIHHTFAVACGLDSMAVGEAQILGQLRTALQRAQARHTVGPVMHSLFQQALRVGKRAHSETSLDRVGASLVDEGLAAASDVLGDLADVHVLVVGAGAMSSLAATTAARRGVAELVIVNRTAERGVRLAHDLGGRAAGWADLAPELAVADLVITCTGAVGHVIDATAVGPGMAAREGRSQVYLDLALPRDVAPEVSDVPGVHVLGLAALGDRLAMRSHAEGDLAVVRDLVTSEVAAYLVSRRREEVAPTVAALRARAADVVAAELGRLESRLPGADEHTLQEVRLSVHRVVEKLLHTPTVRVKELAGQDGPIGDHAQALRELFDLDPRDTANVSAPPRSGGLV